MAAEAIALAASVVNFVQIADRVIEIAKFYIEALHGCPRDLRAIFVEVNSLKTILESLQILLKSPSALQPQTLVLFASDDRPVEMCRRSLADLEKKLPPDTPKTTTNAGDKRKRNFTVQHLAWPLRQNSVNKLLVDIVRYKSIISFALTCESLNDIRDIRNSVGFVKETLTEARHIKVCEWLEVTNPSSNHNEALRLHEDQTCDWILRSADWQSWMSGKKKFIWVHGIPGAGKTILASFLIQQIEATCCAQSNSDVCHERVVCVYYYCFFARDQEEAGPFLRWLVSQLCRWAGSVPIGVFQLYQLSQPPSISQLLEALEQILKEFKTVYVVIDAVDEGHSRQYLLDVLRDFATDHRYERIQILATSGEYLDIETSLSPISTQISMDNPFIAEDIGKYLYSALRTHRSFQSWPPHLLVEVENALNEGAKGMFRWAVCQIDVLRRLGSHQQIRFAIKNLPKTLDETYERIFKLIHEDDAHLVKTVLLVFCAFSHMHLSAHAEQGELITVLYQILAERNEGDDFVSYGISGDYIQDKCGCLLTFNPDKYHTTISLAHYTVREYLYSSHIVSSKASFFALSETMARSLILKFVVGLSHRLYSKPAVLKRRLQPNDCQNRITIGTLNCFDLFCWNCYKSMSVRGTDWSEWRRCLGPESRTEWRNAIQQLDAVTVKEDESIAFIDIPTSFAVPQKGKTNNGNAYDRNDNNG